MANLSIILLYWKYEKISFCEGLVIKIVGTQCTPIKTDCNLERSSFLFPSTLSTPFFEVLPINSVCSTYQKVSEHLLSIQTFLEDVWNNILKQCFQIFFGVSRQFDVNCKCKVIMTVDQNVQIGQMYIHQ